MRLLPMTRRRRLLLLALPILLLAAVSAAVPARPPTDDGSRAPVGYYNETVPGPTADSGVGKDQNITGYGHSGSHKCLLGSLICIHADLKPFLVTALWLLFLVVLLLVFERSEHQQHHQQQLHPAFQSTGGSSGSMDSDGSGVRSRMHRIRIFCNKVFVHGIKEYLPTSCLQILLGLAFAGAFQVTGYHERHLESLDPGLFFHVLLPIIIINAGLGVEKRHFFFNLPAILAYAVVGTVIVALVTGYTIYAISAMNPGPFTGLKNVTKIEALTFGALISAVDPVAVLALFERMHLNKPLYITLFGESVLNDAVSVVLYNMFTQAKSSMVVNGLDEWRPSPLEIGGTAVYSVHVAATGFVIGVTCGFMASGLMRMLPNAGNQNLAVLIVVVSGYISFFLAEYIAASGILSTFVCSIVMSIYLANLTPISQSFLRQSTKSYAEISEGFIYLVMGVSALNLFFSHKEKVIVDVPFIFVTLVLCVLLRFACVYGIGYLLKLGSLTELRASDFFILAYGGLRGAIALALSLMLERKHYKYADEFFACTMMLVLLTCFVNGITLKPLIMFAKIQVDVSVEDSLWDQIMNRTCDYVGFFMGTLTGYQPVMKRVYLGWNNMNDKYLRRALLKSKVYNEAQDEGIYELHRKIVADEFLKFATENKSLIDLNALRSDSMVYAIRRVSSIGNTGGMVYNQSHRSLVLPPFVRQALSVGETLDTLELDSHQDLCNPPVLDMEALSANPAKCERDRDDQQNHHRHFMRDIRIINPRSWQDKQNQQQQPQAPPPPPTATGQDAPQSQQSRQQPQQMQLIPNPSVKFSLNPGGRDDEDDEELQDADVDAGVTFKLDPGEKPASGATADQDDEDEQPQYASRYYAHHPHIIQLPKHSRAGQDQASVVRKFSIVSLQDAAVAAGNGNGGVAKFGKKKSVSFATLSPDQGMLDPRSQQMGALPEHVGSLGDGCQVQGRFQVRVCHESGLHQSDDLLAMPSVPYIRIDDNEVAGPGEEFRYEVSILDSLPWNRGGNQDEQSDGGDRWHRHHRRGAGPTSQQDGGVERDEAIA